MCDASKRLIAWLDRELSEGEAASVERHLQDCGECRSRLSAYQRASDVFNEYCDMVSASKTPHRRARRMAGASVAIAVAALVILLAALPRARFEQRVARSRAMRSQASSSAKAAAPPAVVPETSQAAMCSPKRVRGRSAIAAVQSETKNAPSSPIRNANLLPAGPSVEVAIPAEELYPPGAVPEGVNFIADLRVAADGSPQPMRVRPVLIGFQRRTSEP